MGYKTKYKNKPVYDELGNKLADSKTEYRRFLVLQDLEKRGIIHNLKTQVKFPIVINNNYVGYYQTDFTYIITAKDEYVVEDVKGIRTPLYKWKKKCVKAMYGIDILETK
jgi:hypothetical protein